MIRKLKQWLWERYLPEYCRQQLLEENARLRTELEAVRQRLREQRQYIEGMQDGLRALRRVSIQNNVGKGER